MKKVIFNQRSFGNECLEWFVILDDSVLKSFIISELIFMMLVCVLKRESLALYAIFLCLIFFQVILFLSAFWGEAKASLRFRRIT